MTIDAMTARMLLLTTAYEQVRTTDVLEFSITELAKQCGLSRSRACQLFPKDRLVQEVLRMAVRIEDYRVLRHALVGKHANCVELTAKARKKAIQELSKT